MKRDIEFLLEFGSKRIALGANAGTKSQSWLARRAAPRDSCAAIQAFMP